MLISHLLPESTTAVIVSPEIVLKSEEVREKQVFQAFGIKLHSGACLGINPNGHI